MPRRQQRRQGQRQRSLIEKPGEPGPGNQAPGTQGAAWIAIALNGSAIAEFTGA